MATNTPSVSAVRDSSGVSLRFSIRQRQLAGEVLGRVFVAAAVSGGGANARRTDPDLSNNPDLTEAASRRLIRPVGRDQQNRLEDVRAVQGMLNAVLRPIAPIMQDGACGPQTLAAICTFQRARSLDTTGVIAPESPTYEALKRGSRHYSYTKYEFSEAVIAPDTMIPGHIVSARASDRGGSPPTGEYLLVVDRSTPAGRISMVPRFLTHRSGLQIHASGPIGSDGCIVVLDGVKLRSLRAAVHAAKGHATLSVVQ
jgi:peptidoglycan hydrolase-like protein with peptidoglycan-binding domain